MSKDRHEEKNEIRCSENKLEYYKMRLDHTVKFTHEATRNIYLVNAAVLTAAGFIFGTSNNIPLQMRLYLPPLLIIILIIINLHHAAILFYQAKWYREIDIEFAEFAKVNRPVIWKNIQENPLKRKGAFQKIASKFGTHRVYVSLHVVISIVLIAIAMLILIKGIETKQVGCEHGRSLVAKP